MRKEQLGGLEVRIVGGDDGHGSGTGPVVALLHGFGAPGDDLVDLSSALRVPTNTRFVFPEAPLSLASQGYGSGRAWWMLDLDALERRARGERVDRSQELPDGLVSARAQLAAMFRELEEKLSVPREQLVVGGFSQGSMLACDFVLHSEHKPAALILLSSTLLAQADWQPRMAASKRVSILQSHGRRDQLLAFADAEKLRDLWHAAGAHVTFIEFPGGHELPPAVLNAVSRFITEHAG